MIYLLLVLLADPISITVVKGTIITRANNEIQIGPGTYIPDPHDKELAKKIIKYKTEIKNLNVRISTLEEKLSRKDRHIMDVDKMWGDSYDALNIKYKAATGWFRTWGLPLLVGVVSFSAGVFGTYLMVEKI